MIDIEQCWETPAVGGHFAVVEIDGFNARGMRHLDAYVDPVRHSVAMDIWVAHDGRILVKCSSRDLDIDGRCFEIPGTTAEDLLRRDEDGHLQDAWIPQEARRAWARWVEDEH